MKFTVYRIQDKDGRGPFKPGYTEKWMDKDRTFFPKAVINQQIHIQRIADPDLHLAYVCESVEQLKKWFSPTEYEYLKKCGYSAVRMSVDTIWTCEDQAIAGRKKQYRKSITVIPLYEKSV